MKPLATLTVLTLALVSGIPALWYCAAFAVPVIRRSGESVELWPSSAWLERSAVLVLIMIMAGAAVVFGGAE